MLNFRSKKGNFLGRLGSFFRSLFLGLLILQIFFPVAAFALVLFSVEPSKASLVPDEIFTVEVVFDSQENINSIEGELVFPVELLEFQAVNLEDSAINFWIREPDFSLISISSQGEKSTYGSIAFSGLILGGYQGVGNVFQVTFQSRVGGSDNFDLRNLSVLLNDGEGTDVDVEVRQGVGNFSIAQALSYKVEQELVKKEGIVTKDYISGANKCEFIVMNGRVSKWAVDIGKVKSEYFDDINQAGVDWCVPYADFAYENGIVEGRAEGIFGVSGFVSRYEVAVILARELSDVALDSQIETDFLDDADFPAWARGAIGYLSENGIFHGYALPDGGFVFGGNDSILKVDAAIVLYRTFLK